MNEKLVSIIIPVYKVERYLQDCIDSITNQTYKHLEIILIDDGSPDNCGKICDKNAKRDSRIKVIHKTNGGLGSARNAGLNICTGDYITFLDSDDLFSPDCVEYLIRICQTEGVKLAASGVEEFEDGSDPTYHNAGPEVVEKISSEEALKKCFYMDGLGLSVHGKIFSRELIREIRNPEGIYYEDIRPMYLAIDAAGYIGYSNAFKCAYRYRSTSQSNQAFTLKEILCISEMDYVRECAIKKYPELAPAIASRVISANAHIFLMIPRGEYKKEQMVCWQSIKQHRLAVIKDPYSRKKAKAFALLSFCGRHFTHMIGKKLVYRGE